MDLDDIDTVDELPARPRRTIPEADRELLELAARALGAVRVEDIEGEEYLILHFADGSVANGWNPLLHSDDAFKLQVALDAWPTKSEWSDGLYIVIVLPNGSIEAEPIGADPVTAARRAVTRAAAQIGKPKD